MTTVNVQFSDSTETEVVAYFGAPQDPAAYVNLGSLALSDGRWAAFYESVGFLAQLELPAPTA